MEATKKHKNALILQALFVARNLNFNVNLQSVAFRSLGFVMEKGENLLLV